MPKVKSDTGRKVKNKKDPNAPKRPLSAYFIWLQDFRAKMRVEDPDLVKSVKDFGKAAGAAWQEISEEEREPYQQQHLEQKANYEEAMKSYVPPKGYSKTGSKSNSKKAKKDPNAPKKPSTAFFLFMADGNRERLKRENPDITPAQIGKALGAEWREMDAKTKSKYEQIYETNLEQWRKDKAAYDRGEANNSRSQESEESEEETDSE